MTEREQDMAMGFLLGSGSVDTDDIVEAIKSAHAEGIELKQEWENWAKDHPQYFN